MNQITQKILLSLLLFYFTIDFPLEIGFIHFVIDFLRVQRIF